MSRTVNRLAIASLLAWAGCAEDQELASRVASIKTRQNAEAADMTDAKMALSLVGGGTTFCAGATPAPQLRATVTTHGVPLRTPIQMHSKSDPPGTFPQTMIKLSANPPILGPDWMLRPPSQPADALSLLERPVEFAGELVKQPGVKTTLRLTASYDCDQTAAFPARAGRPGGVGGMRGEPGENGLDLEVGVTYVKSAAGQKVVLVKAVPSVGPSQYFLLAPGRKLSLDVRGGDGGRGGDGKVTGSGVGGGGFRGGVAFTASSVNFSRGLGGDGGNGGRVTVRIDERHPELRSVVSAVNPGGRGGLPGDGEGDATTSAGRPGRPGPAASQQNQRVDEIFKEELDAGLSILRE
jgi:hypothetical protein